MGDPGCVLQFNLRVLCPCAGTVRRRKNKGDKEMIRRPKSKTFSPEMQAAIFEASAKQTGKSVTPKSYDPVNFPVFDTPVNQKLLVYVPNHTVAMPDGSVAMRMDKFAAHSCIDGRQFATVRCTSGIVNEDFGLDGTCPLCSCKDDVWELYKLEYADIAKAKGIATDSPEAKTLLKQDRKDLLDKMAVNTPEVWMVFPIVVIDCIEKDGKLTLSPKMTDDGQLSGKAMWYAIREKTYKEKWEAAFDGVADVSGEVPTSPAGLWAILNFTYQSDDGKFDKMNSARNLKVTYKAMPGYEQWAAYFDKMTEEWTPLKSSETVIAAAFRDMDEMNEVADSIMADTRAKLSLYAMRQAGAVAPTQTTAPGSADATLASFGAAPASPPAEVGGELPNTGIE